MTTRRAPSTPDCIGQIRQKYSRYCGDDCPMAHLCTMLAIREYARQIQRLRKEVEDEERERLDNG